METTTEEKKFMFKDVMEYLPIASLIILGGGILQLKIYYSFFDLNIFPYIELSEVVLTFINDLLWFSIGFAFMIPLSYGMRLKAQEEKEEKEKKKKLYVIPLFGAIFILLVLISILYSNIFPVNIFVPLIGITVFILLGFDSMKRTKHFFHSTHPKTFYSILLLVAFIATTIFTPMFRAGAFLENENFHSSSMTVYNKEIKSWEKEFIIGKTNNYVFTYDSLLKESRVYPISKIKSLKVGLLPYSSGSELLFGEEQDSIR